MIKKANSNCIRENENNYMQLQALKNEIYKSPHNRVNKSIKFQYSIETKYIHLCKKQHIPLCGAINEYNQFCRVMSYSLCSFHKRRRSTIQAIITRTLKLPKCLSNIIANLVIGK